MKQFLTLSLLLAFALCANTACTTAHHVAHGSADVAAHSVEKTGHAVGHGIRKVEKHL